MTRIAAAISLTVCLSTPLSAAQIGKSFMVGNWSVGAYTNDQTGIFNHCAASVNYLNGITTFFAINRAYSWSMGFANPNWSLQPGTRYSIAFSIDRIPALNATATAIMNKMVEVPLADSSGLFTAFRRGRTLTVYGAGQVFEFNLTGTSRVLAVLAQCVNYEMHPVTAEAPNPFGHPVSSTPELASPSAPPTPTSSSDSPNSIPPSTSVASSHPSEEDRRLEATEFLADLLGQAGITGYRMLNSAETKKLDVDAAWTDGSEIGAVNILEQTKGFGPNEAEAIIIAEGAKMCPGKFLSGSKSGDSKLKDIEAFTSCTNEGKTITTMLTIFPKDESHLYVLRTIANDSLGSTSSSDRAKDVDANVRSAAYKIMK